MGFIFLLFFFFFFKQKTAYEMRISDWSSDVCSSDLKAPDMPVRNKVGTNTAHKTSTIAISAADTSSIDALAAPIADSPRSRRSAEHTYQLKSLMRISDAVFCMNKPIK